MSGKNIKSLGFSLIELMTVVSIVGILASIATPSFISAIRNSRLTSANNEMVTALNLARSEAVKRAQNVVVRKSGTNWEDGWEVFVDADESNAFNDNGNATLCEDNEDCLLRVYQALPANYTLRGNNFSTYIVYRANGQSNTNGSFAICDVRDGNDTPASGTSRLIIVNNIGRVRQAQDDNNDGIPNKDDGNNLNSCTSP